LIFFASERKSYTHEYSKPIVKHIDSTKSEKNIKPRISFKLPTLRSGNRHCLKDSITIEDNVTSFSRKICYWGDGDSSIYSGNQTKLSHKYLDSGTKTIQLVCDTFMPASYKFLVYCVQPDSSEFSIHPPDRPNITKDTLIFNRNLKLYFESSIDDAKWLIDGETYGSNAEITFKKHNTIEVVFLPGKTRYDCICDSTLQLTFVKRKRG